MHLKTVYPMSCIMATLGLISAIAMAGDLTPKMQIKIVIYKKQCAIWTADPAIVKAVQDANAKGPINGMGNGKPNFAEAFDGKL